MVQNNKSKVKSQNTKKSEKIIEEKQEQVMQEQVQEQVMQEQVQVQEQEQVMQEQEQVTHETKVKKNIKKSKKETKQDDKKVKTTKEDIEVTEVTEITEIPEITKKIKKLKKVKTDTINEQELDEDNKTRSFKVQLPTETEFTGRFTGLTPYQAANKALSKYFRNNDNVNINGEEIIFNIKESTRGSKRATYAYKGKRIKLKDPIQYKIKASSGEERIIIKQYKNHLTKIKKGLLNKDIEENIVATATV